MAGLAAVVEWLLFPKLGTHASWAHAASGGASILGGNDRLQSCHHILVLLSKPFNRHFLPVVREMDREPRDSVLGNGQMSVFQRQSSPSSENVWSSHAVTA